MEHSELSVPLLTRVVHCKEDRFDIYIGRGSKWGNPFKIWVHGNRAEVIAMYETYLRGRQDLLDSLHELRGVVLGCHCKPLDCHGDVIVKLLKEYFPGDWY